MGCCDIGLRGVLIGGVGICARYAAWMGRGAGLLPIECHVFATSCGLL